MGESRYLSAEDVEGITDEQIEALKTGKLIFGGEAFDFGEDIGSFIVKMILTARHEGGAIIFAHPDWIKFDGDEEDE